MTLRSWAWVKVLLKETLDLYLSSYQIGTKSIMLFGKYELLKNFNVNVGADADTGGSAIALPGLRPGELKTDHIWHRCHTTGN